MRIAVVSSTVFSMPPAGYSGLEQLAWQRAEGLAKKGHDVILIGPDGTRCDHARVHHTGPPGQHSEEMAYGGFKYKTGRKVKNEKNEDEEEEITVPPYWPLLLDQDVIIDDSWQKWAICLKQEGRLKAPVLCVSHAPVNTMYSILPPSGIDKPCMVCISQDQGEHLKALFPVDVRVAYNGVDVDQYKPLGIPRSNRFLFLARFSSVKSPDIAIEACKRAGVPLDLVGDTKLTGEPEYLQSILYMADGKNIRFVGPASRGECVFWFSQAHALVHPVKNFREPFGLAPVESQLCGCPVLAWRNGALPETVREGETGFLVNSLEKAVELIRSGALDQINRKRCREWASQFSLDNFISRYEELCIEAVEGGGW